MGKSIGNKFLSVLIGFVLLCLFLFNSVEAEISKKDWQVLSGKWSFSALHVKGFADEEDGILLYKGGEFKNFSCSVRVKPVNREGSLILRALDTKNCYLLIFLPEGANEGRTGIALAKRVNGKETYFAGIATKYKINQWVNVKTIFKGENMKVYLNSKLVLTSKDNIYKSGKVGLRIYGKKPKSCTTFYEDFKIEAIK